MTTIGQIHGPAPLPRPGEPSLDAPLGTPGAGIPSAVTPSATVPETPEGTKPKDDPPRPVIVGPVHSWNPAAADPPSLPGEYAAWLLSGGRRRP